MDEAARLTADEAVLPGAPVAVSSRVGKRVSRAFTRRWLALTSLLTAPVAWLLVIYIGSLVALVAVAMFKLDGRTQRPTTSFTTDNLREAFTQSEFLKVVAQSLGAAVAVTVLSVVIAVPVTFCVARVLPRWMRRGVVVAFLLPLWAGYLVKAYAWKAMLRQGSKFGVDQSGGFLQSVFGWSPGFGWLAVILSLTYLWLPYMLLPVYTGMERLPNSLVEASSDLGAKPLRTFASVAMPMLTPAIAAGSIFTFSLSLGDYIIPAVVTERKVIMIGNLVERTLLAPNQPLAAAFTLWPLAIIVVYLLAMRRAGAFESV